MERLLETDWCLLCGDEVPHERVPCDDGHGDECPDRVCIRCGAVVWSGPAPADDDRSGRRRVA